MLKTCKNCLQELPLDQYGPDGRTTDGLNPKCYACRGQASPGATEKMCKICLETKRLREFPRDMAAADGFRSICKLCASANAKRWNKEHKERFASNQREWQKANKTLSRDRNRRYHLTSTYGITDDEYWAIFDAQGGRCALCGTKPSRKHLHVDHDHRCCKGNKSCGACVRGLLCNRCNKDLMPFVDHKPEAVKKAVGYSTEWPAQEVLRIFQETEDEE